MAIGKNILVTGGAGYLGAILVPSLLAAGHRVVVLDNLLHRPSSLLECCSNPRFDFVRGDCRDETLLRKLVAGADVIIPLAALVGAPLCAREPAATLTTNRDAVVLLVKLLSPRQALLYPTTNSGYGVGKKGEFCTEDSPLQPVSIYGRSKVEAERVVLESGRAISFRFATAFGASPRMRTDLLVNDFVYRAVFDRAVVLFEPHFKRNFIHIRDIARVFHHGIDQFDQMKGQPYNVGLSDANLSKVELCQQIQRHIPGFVFVESAIGEDPDKRDYMVSNARIESTGWRPQFTLDDGIRELIKAYQMIKNNQYANV